MFKFYIICLTVVLMILNLVNSFCNQHNCWNTKQEQQLCDNIYGVNCWPGYLDEGWFYDCYCCNSEQMNDEDGVVDWENDRKTFYNRYIMNYPRLLETCVPPDSYSQRLLRCIKYGPPYCS